MSEREELGLSTEKHLAYLFDLGSAYDETHKEFSYCVLEPAFGNNLRDFFLCRAEGEISICVFFDGDIDQDCPPIKVLDGDDTTSAGIGV